MAKPQNLAIDRASEDYKKRRAALEQSVQSFVGKTEGEGDAIYATPLPPSLLAEMNALDVEFKGDKLVDVAAKDVGDKDPEISEDMADSINAVDKSIKENADPQKNKSSYDLLNQAVSKYLAGELSLEELLKVMDEVGGENKDVAVQSHLVCIRAAVSNPSLEKDKQKQGDALSTINKAFAYLGDESKKHDLEAALLAAQAVVESDKIPQDAKAKIEEGIGNIDVEIDDNSPQQSAADQKDEAKENAADPSHKKEKNAVKEKTHKISTAKKVAKYTTALAVACGVPPPFGICIALAGLYMARNIGERKKDRASELDLEKNQEILKASKQRLEDAKSKRLAAGMAEEEKEGAESGDEKDPALVGQSGEENKADAPAATKTKAAVTKVAQEAQGEVKDSGNQLANAGNEKAPAPESDQDVQQRNHQQERADELVQENEAIAANVNNGEYVEVSAAGESKDDNDNDEDKDPKENKGPSPAVLSEAAQDEPGNAQGEGYLEVDASQEDAQESLNAAKNNAARNLAQGVVFTANIEAAQEKEKADSQPAAGAPEVKKEGGISQ